MGTAGQYWFGGADPRRAALTGARRPFALGVADSLGERIGGRLFPAVQTALTL